MNITKDRLALIINKHSDFDNEGIWIPDFESAATEINNLTKPEWSTFEEWWRESEYSLNNYNEVDCRGVKELAKDAWEAARK